MLSNDWPRSCQSRRSAPEVGSLHVFQRRANWAAPLNNYEISAEKMAEIRARYDEIFESLQAQMERGLSPRD